MGRQQDFDDTPTEFIREEVSQCDNLDDLREKIFPIIKSQRELWIKKIQEIFEKSGQTKSKFAELCGVSRVTLDKWLNKGVLPKNRETFLRIGLVAELNRRELDQLLQRYGRYPGLYPKSLDDCICIFVADHHYGAESLEKYTYILSEVKKNFPRYLEESEASAEQETAASDDIVGVNAGGTINTSDADGGNKKRSVGEQPSRGTINTRAGSGTRPDHRTAEEIFQNDYYDNPDPDNVETEYFAGELSEVSDEEELQDFIKENAIVFSTAYRRFYSYVLAYIKFNNINYATKNVYGLSAAQEWTPSLVQCVSAIRQYKWFPTRNKIISLGLHLAMDYDEINKMLTYAHMEPLCAKNIFESTIMYILQDADLNDVLNIDAEDYDPDRLLSFARETLEKLDIPEIDAFLEELPDLSTD